MKLFLTPRNSIGFFVLFAGLFPLLSHAESVLHAYGEAQVREYRAMKALPPNTTHSQVKQIRNQAYEHFNQVYREDVRKKKEGIGTTGASLVNNLNKTIAAKGKGPAKTGVPIEGEAPKAAAAPAGGRKDGSAATVTGPSGAKDVKFGDGQGGAPAPTVVDGIIQDR